MAKFRVEGGHRLSGEITPQGAKNEALQIICAALLTPERVVLHNVPIIAVTLVISIYFVTKLAIIRLFRHNEEVR